LSVLASEWGYIGLGRYQRKSKIMGYFRVLLHGSGIRVEGGELSRPIIGFYTTRMVRAASEGEAQVIAMESVRMQWATGAEAKCNQGDAPALKVEEVSPAKLLQGLLFRNKGHSFYSEDDHVI
jgi:hypothetical protein